MSTMAPRLAGTTSEMSSIKGRSSATKPRIAVIAPLIRINASRSRETRGAVASCPAGARAKTSSRLIRIADGASGGVSLTLTSSAAEILSTSASSMRKAAPC